MLKQKLISVVQRIINHDLFILWCLLSLLIPLLGASLFVTISRSNADKTSDTIALEAQTPPSSYLKLGASFIDADGKPQEVEGEINNLAFDHQKNLIVPCVGRGTMIIAAKGIDFFIHGDANSFVEAKRQSLADNSVAVSYSLTCQPDSPDIVIEAIGAIPTADTP